MMTISESQYSTNKMSSYHKINDRIVHQDNFDDTQSSLVTNRGFKPSDMYDPQKKQFLTNLSYKLFPVSWEDLEHKPVIVGNKEVDLNKIFTPAPDAEEHLIKKGSGLEKTFASSAFYVPGVHPTVKEQMDLARAISRSLSDSSNQMSRGQSMYVNRKKRSVKWVHEGRGRNTSNSCSTPTPVANHDTPYRPPSSLRSQKTYPKPALKNPTPTFKNPPPKHNLFSSPPPIINVQNLDLPVIAPTKLNDYYARPKSPRLPLVSGPNFNVAPRGWGEMREYYRPVALDSVGRSSMIYTDY